jgi:hypothetical protein
MGGRWKSELTSSLSDETDTKPAYEQIFIRDVKSSNGTFINGERLSQEGLESDPYELKTEDVVVRIYRGFV